MATVIEERDDELQELEKATSDLSNQLSDLKKLIGQASKTVDNGLRMRTGPFVRDGENIMSSRTFSVGRLVKGLLNRDAGRTAKIEMELCGQLASRYEQLGHVVKANTVLVPLGASLMPFESSFVKLVRDVTAVAGDPDEMRAIRKDLVTGDAQTGGTLVPSPSQGELITFLRAATVFDRAGCRQVPLPSQGSIRYPRFTSDATVAAAAEGGSTNESTPGTGELLLTAKTYRALVDVTEEFLRFAANGSAEAVLRQEMTRAAAVKAEADMFAGQGGTSIKGLITYSAATNRTASTTGANGDTLHANDPAFLIGDVAGANVDLQSGFFAIRPQLWARVTHRRADAVSAADAAGAYLFRTTFANAVGGERVADMLEGFPVFLSTNVPADRAKGSGTNLTLLFFAAASEIIIGRVGVAELAVTNSDDTKFRSGVSSVRLTLWQDAGPVHEQSVGYIDQLLPTT